MGTFAETAILDYHLSLAKQEKQNFVFLFRLQQTNGSLPFLFPFVAKNGSCRFLFSFVFRLRNSGNMET
jgi:hypothetical protein